MENVVILGITVVVVFVGLWILNAIRASDSTAERTLES